MAQHCLIENIDHSALRRIERGIRQQRSFSGSLRYEEIKDDLYKETPEDRVFVTHRNVPESVVVGGKASFEVHTIPSKVYGQIATNIYIVA